MLNELVTTAGEQFHGTPWTVYPRPQMKRENWLNLNGAWDFSVNYEKQGQIFIKPHPRDELDYSKVFPGYPMFDGTMPMEMLNFFEGLRFDIVVTVFTDLKGITFADKLVRLGDEFMDKYEDPMIHNQNKRIGILEKEDKTISKQ